MPPARRILAALLPLALAACSVSGAPEAANDDHWYGPPPLELVGRVVDAAHVLAPARKASLTRQLAGIEKDGLGQFVVVTTPGLEGKSIEDYSLALGRGWGIGDTKRNDGLLLVVAPNERKVRIELGRGMEDVLSDPLCFEIIQDDIIPRFKAGDMEGGIQAGVDRLEHELRSRATKKAA